MINPSQSHMALPSHAISIHLHSFLSPKPTFFTIPTLHYSAYRANKNTCKFPVVVLASSDTGENNAVEPPKRRGRPKKSTSSTPIAKKTKGSAQNSEIVKGSVQNSELSSDLAQNGEKTKGSAQKAEIVKGSVQNSELSNELAQNGKKTKGLAQNGERAKGLAQNAKRSKGSAQNSEILKGSVQNGEKTEGLAHSERKEKGLAQNQEMSKGLAQNEEMSKGLAQNTKRSKGLAPKGKRSKGLSKKEEKTNGSVVVSLENDEGDDGDDDDDDFSDFEDDMKGIKYMDPPLVCCFGAVQKDFVPTVKVSEIQEDPDKYSEWKHLQWKPPEFARAPGGPPSNVAIAHVRAGGRAAIMGKVGRDAFGEELVLMMNMEKVQTRGVKFDGNYRTACSFMKIVFDEKDKKMRMELVKEAAEDAMLPSELNLGVLREARIFHFNSEVLMSPSMRSTLFRAIKFSKKFGSLVFFDPNFPLPLWKSPDETRQLVKRAWEQSNIIEVHRLELELLLDPEYYEWRYNYRHLYHSENKDIVKGRRQYYHYTREDIAPLWHDGLKILFVTDGTLRIHFYTPSFDGVVVGTEDVLVAHTTCDRSGSGDAMVAAIMRKLITHPEMFEDQDVLVRQLRFAVAAGIIAQWTVGSVRGLPTESASQNLKEQVYVPSMW